MTTFPVECWKCFQFTLMMNYFDFSHSQVRHERSEMKIISFDIADNLFWHCNEIDVKSFKIDEIPST